MSSDTFNLPPTDEVLQRDERPLEAIPVDVKGVVQTDTMPARVGAMRNVLLALGDRPVQVLPDRPTRRRAILWYLFLGAQATDTTIGVLLSTSFAACSSLDGAPIWTVNAVTRYELETSSEVWARGIEIVNASGRLSTLRATTANDVLLSVMTENWAR